MAMLIIDIIMFVLFLLTGGLLFPGFGQKYPWALMATALFVGVMSGAFLYEVYEKNGEVFGVEISRYWGAGASSDPCANIVLSDGQGCVVRGGRPYITADSAPLPPRPQPPRRAANPCDDIVLSNGQRCVVRGGRAVVTSPRDQVLTVDAAGGGDYRRIQQAINAAPEGATIRIRPGTYREALRVSKPLTLLGDGARERIIIEKNGAHTLHWTAPRGRVVGLTLRALTSDKAWGAINITSGAPVLEDLDLTSAAGSAVYIGGANAAPTLRRSRIHDSTQMGVHIYDNAQGLIEDNDITGNTYSGIQIGTGAAPTVRGNRIRNNQAGVLVWKNGRGEIVDNDITGNAYAGVEIRESGNPTVRGNTISGSGYQGVWVHDNGRGTIIGNDLRGNTRGAFHIESSAGTVTRRDNRGLP